MPFVSLSDLDPAYDLLALVEKISGSTENTSEEKSEEKSEGKIRSSPLISLVQEEKYRELLEQGFFARSDKILAASGEEIKTSFSLCFFIMLRVQKQSQGDVSDMILRLATLLSQDSSHASVKLGLLAQLFNLLDRASPLRVTVFLKLARLALASNMASQTVSQFEKIDGWLSDWKLPEEKQAELYLLMAQSHDQAQSKTKAEYYLIKYLKSFGSADSKRLDIALEHAARAAKSAIANPTLLQCDGLLNLAPVAHLAQSSPLHRQLHRLLSIFALHSVAEFDAFAAEHKAAFEALGLDEAASKAKMLRLSLVTLAAARTELKYVEIKESLSLADFDEVEDVVIDTVTAGSLDAKLDQEQEIVQIRRVDQRNFSATPEAWGKLNTQLSLWSQNIASVLNHMANNRQSILEEEDMH